MRRGMNPTKERIRFFILPQVTPVSRTSKERGNRFRKEGPS